MPILVDARTAACGSLARPQSTAAQRQQPWRPLRGKGLKPWTDATKDHSASTLIEWPKAVATSTKGSPSWTPSFASSRVLQRRSSRRPTRRPPHGRPHRRARSPNRGTDGGLLLPRPAGLRRPSQGLCLLGARPSGIKKPAAGKVRGAQGGKHREGSGRPARGAAQGGQGSESTGLLPPRAVNRCGVGWCQASGRAPTSGSTSMSTAGSSLSTSPSSSWSAISS